MYELLARKLNLVQQLLILFVVYSMNKFPELIVNSNYLYSNLVSIGANVEY